MDDLLSLKVFSPSGVEIDLEGVSSVNIRLENGMLLGILPGHAPLVASSAKGELICTQNGERKKLAVAAGILTVEKNLVKILTTS